ncbi:MAG: hypothetical protein ABI082_09285 [Dokdonella sp.]
MLRIIICATALILAGLASATHATVFCVNSEATANAALTTAQANGADDEVDIVAGTYALTTGLYFSSAEAHSLTVVGGWNAGCSAFTGAATVLDGQGLVRPLFVAESGSASINIQWLTFADGLSTNNRGGGLSVFTDSGEIRIDHNRFIFNRADDYGGALDAYTNGGQMRVRGNLFFANSAANIGGAELTSNNSVAYVIGNTILGNSSDNFNSSGGLAVSGAAHFWVSDNIVWNNTANGAVDLSAGAWIALINNDVGTKGGTQPDPVSQGNQSVAPDFASCAGLGCFSFELMRASTLVDAGYDSPPGGALAYDLAMKPRTIGPHVDIGAYEQDVLFRNGFE